MIGAWHRWRQLELRGSGKFSQEEEDAYVEKLKSRKVRLSETDCIGLSLEELEVLDRSKNYVLPLEIKKRVSDYRGVYGILSPEEENFERMRDEVEFQKNKKKLEKEQNSNFLRSEQGQTKTQKDQFTGFNFKNKFNQENAAPVESIAQKIHQKPTMDKFTEEKNQTKNTESGAEIIPKTGNPKQPASSKMEDIKTPFNLKENDITKSKNGSN